MGLLSHAIHKHSCRPQHTSVLTTSSTCTRMIRQVGTNEPSFFNATSGMHRRPYEGRHVVQSMLSLKFNFVYYSGGRFWPIFESS